MTDNISFQFQISVLWNAVLHLSLPADEQLSILQSMGIPNIIDELALSFDDVFRTANEAFERGLLNTKELIALRELDAALDKMSGSENAEKWTPSSLAYDKEWEHIRILARHALSQHQP